MGGDTASSSDVFSVTAIVDAGDDTDWLTDKLLALVAPESTVQTVNPAIVTTGSSTAACVDKSVWR
ncbi:MAG: hypothetical protein E6G93_15670 [Alphaproteobacteria bacterium]|nr:MAG: hypothetical protein E6G93_15670 [Alphaproteobacteria bacterium]